MARVVLLCLDGFPAARLTPEVAPNLLALAHSGGHAPEGGLAELPASTYPNHASLLTGASVRRHGVHAHPDGAGGIASPRARSPRIPTVVERAQRAGVSAACAVGDQYLVELLRLDAADSVWPASAEPPAGARRCLAGYLRDESVAPALLEAVGSQAQLVFGQLNESDTAGHVFGPDSDRAADVYRAADAVVGAVLDAARDRWQDTVVIVVSDHGMEPIEHALAVDLSEAPAAAAVLADGAAAWVRPRSSHDELERQLQAMPGIGSCIPFTDELALVTAQRGWHVAAPLRPPRGVHGGPSTQATLAVVGGGHPEAARLGAAVRASRPPLTSWASAILDLLEVPPESGERPRADAVGAPATSPADPE